jgi:hypothetical protein
MGRIIVTDGSWGAEARERGSLGHVRSKELIVSMEEEPRTGFARTNAITTPAATRPDR